MFEPRQGMKTNDAYLHGIGRIDFIGKTGRIECVGSDWFVLRIVESGEVHLIREENYSDISKGDFK